MNARDHKHAFAQGQLSFHCTLCECEVFDEAEAPESLKDPFNPLAGLGVEILSVLEIHPDGAVLKIKVKKS